MLRHKFYSLFVRRIRNVFQANSVWTSLKIHKLCFLFNVYLVAPFYTLNIRAPMKSQEFIYKTQGNLIDNLQQINVLISYLSQMS